jgi:hypothetical protein
MHGTHSCDCIRGVCSFIGRLPAMFSVHMLTFSNHTSLNTGTRLTS